MPCMSGHMEPTAREDESSRLMTLLYEVGKVDKKPDCYGDVRKLDEHTAMLCKFCQENNVTDYSLELQIWWRDHQKADRERLKQEAKEAKDKAAYDRLVATLSDYELNLLKERL